MASAREEPKSGVGVTVMEKVVPAKEIQGFAKENWGAD